MVSCSRHYWAVQSISQDYHIGTALPLLEITEVSLDLPAQKNPKTSYKYIAEVIIDCVNGNIWPEKRVAGDAEEILYQACLSCITFLAAHVLHPGLVMPWVDVVSAGYHQGANTQKPISRGADGMEKSEFLVPNIILAHRVFVSSWGRALLCQGTQGGHRS